MNNMYSLNRIRIEDIKDISVDDFKKQMELDEQVIKNELEQYRKQANFFDFDLDEHKPKETTAEEYLKGLVENEKQEELARKIRFKKFKTERCFNEYFEEVKRITTNKNN